MNQKIETLEAKLDDFDPEVRDRALQELVSYQPAPPSVRPNEREMANMHCHTFFSFNGYGYSPTALAWLARQRDIDLLGIVDFDVLDGVDEFLSACDSVGMRGSAGMETRVYIPEFATREINSPGEPGVYYHMGIGFTTGRVPNSVASIVADMRRRAVERNRDMLARVNRHLDPLIIDYERDVLPLTPKGNATERHMLAAYLEAAGRTVSEPVPFWADKLGLTRNEILSVIEDKQKFQNLVRARLMKRGGVGYVQPGPNTFPSVDEFHKLIVACGALPCAAWLDGTSQGEQDIEELLDLLIGKGVVALNIIPDRNWNISDPDVKKLKLNKLYEMVELAQDLDLPLNIGTEMNSFGQKFVDDFEAPELAQIREAFINGAYFIYGHTAAQRALGLGYQSRWAEMHLPGRPERNKFYVDLGRQVAPGSSGLETSRKIGKDGSPSDILAKL